MPNQSSLINIDLDTQSWTTESNVYVDNPINVNNLNRQYPIDYSPSQTNESNNTPVRKKSTDVKSFGSIFGLGKIKLRREVPRQDSVSGSLRKESDVNLPYTSSGTPTKDSNMENNKPYDSETIGRKSYDRKAGETVAGSYESQSSLRQNFYTKSKNFITGNRNKQRMSLSIEVDENNNPVGMHTRQRHKSMAVPYPNNPSITQELQKRLDATSASLPSSVPKLHSLSTKTNNTTNTSRLSSKPPLPISGKMATSAANPLYNMANNSLMTATSLDDKHFCSDEASTNNKSNEENANTNSQVNVFEANFDNDDDVLKSGMGDLGEGDETSIK